MCTFVSLVLCSASECFHSVWHSPAHTSHTWNIDYYFTISTHKASVIRSFFCLARCAVIRSAPKSMGCHDFRRINICIVGDHELCCLPMGWTVRDLHRGPFYSPPFVRRYRAIADRLLKMRLGPLRRLARRDVSYEFMNRQMVWHAFTVRRTQL